MFGKWVITSFWYRKASQVISMLNTLRYLNKLVSNMYIFCTRIYHRISTKDLVLLTWFLSSCCHGSSRSFKGLVVLLSLLLPFLLSSHFPHFKFQPFIAFSTFAILAVSAILTSKWIKLDQNWSELIKINQKKSI